MDQPLTRAAWRDLGSRGTLVMQMPFAVRPLALVYSNGANATVAGADAIPRVKLSPCNLARIIKGEISR